eukprot:TRINITY_DN330_c0_g1_i5.p1 TRINITY_DN330_c0_g1~~TRINITY_DN330_c0_g1_i5.p1  ORF type:complete len:119 (-),score=19.37 TRINITY_DN330_c0_g1_i5:302-658(-)
MASQKLISNGYISVAQLNSVPPSAADLDMLGFTLLERNLILQTLKPPTESSEIKDLKRKCTELEQEIKVEYQKLFDQFSLVTSFRPLSEINTNLHERPSKRLKQVNEHHPSLPYQRKF